MPHAPHPRNTVCYPPPPQAAFQNITRIMDCVGCEKCKLWGKLQTLGEPRGARGHSGSARERALLCGKARAAPRPAARRPAATSPTHPQTRSPAPGVATALKVLFASKDCAGGGAPDQSDLSLERNEAIALVNLLARFSNSLHLYHELSGRLRAEGRAAAAVVDASQVLS